MRENENTYRGFTLLEVLVTIAIVALLSGIVSNSMSSLASKYRLNSAGRELLSDFQNAKSRAVQNKKRVVLDFNQNKNEYKMFVDRDRDYSLDGGEKKLKQCELGKGLEISKIGISFNNTETGFNSMGTPASCRIGHVKLKDSAGRELKVVLSMSGRVRIEK